MTLREKQSWFSLLVSQLILYAYIMDYEVTFGDAYNVDINPVIDYLRKRMITGDDVEDLIKTLMTIRHERDKSFHYKRLAIDLNLFKDGKYLTKTEDHRVLGEYWKSLDPMCSWGGDWGDGNHYSYGEGK